MVQSLCIIKKPKHYARLGFPISTLEADYNLTQSTRCNACRGNVFCIVRVSRECRNDIATRAHGGHGQLLLLTRPAICPSNEIHFVLSFRNIRRGDVDNIPSQAVTTQPTQCPAYCWQARERLLPYTSWKT